MTLRITTSSPAERLTLLEILIKVYKGRIHNANLSLEEFKKKFPYDDFWVIVFETNTEGYPVIYGSRANSSNNVDFATGMKKLIEFYSEYLIRIEDVGDFSAILNKKEKTVTVGSQTIKFSKVLEISHAIKKILDIN